jgi:hypothetical protein
MKDNREFNYCKECNIPKLPRTHHCSQCNACCIKYDHHCGMVMNCIGANNYHLFLQFMFLTMVFFSFGGALNVYYNFYLDFKTTYDYTLKVGIVSLIVLAG